MGQLALPHPVFLTGYVGGSKRIGELGTPSHPTKNSELIKRFDLMDIFNPFCYPYTVQNKLRAQRDKLTQFWIG